MKRCFKCGVEKPLVEYYPHKQMADGHLNKCKECTKKDTKARTDEKIKDPDFLELEQQRHREKYHRLNYRDKHKPLPEKQKEGALQYKLRYPEKVAAKSKLGKSPIGCHFHHWSYKKEHHKDVIPLRIKDHHTLHRFLVYDQQSMCYKTKSGLLLDTKEKHIAHAKTVFEINGTEPNL
jgi:hypothetical protein